MITRRRMLAATGGLAALAAAGAGPAGAQEKLTTPTTRRIRTMEIKRSGSQPSGKGPADYFTGTVRIDPLFQAPDPARARGASVTFEPGARTAWHTHPLGQTLDRHVRLRVGAGLGRPGRGDPPRRRGLVCAGREALARRDAHDRHDAYRHPGGARRQGRRLDGARQRRAVPRLISCWLYVEGGKHPEAQTRKHRTGGFGNRVRLHGHDGRPRTTGQQTGDDPPDLRGGRARCDAVRYGRGVCRKDAPRTSTFAFFDVEAPPTAKATSP